MEQETYDQALARVRKAGGPLAEKSKIISKTTSIDPDLYRDDTGIVAHTETMTCAQLELVVRDVIKRTADGWHVHPAKTRWTVETEDGLSDLTPGDPLPEDVVFLRCDIRVFAEALR